MLKLKIRPLRGDVFLAPLNTHRYDVKTFVAAGSQIARQRHSHATTAAAYVKRTVGGFQVAVLDEDVEEGLTDGPVAFLAAAPDHFDEVVRGY